MKLDWKLVTYILGLVFAAGGLYTTVNQLKENQAKFIRRTEAALQEERFNHRMDLMELKVKFHHPSYYPGPIAPPTEGP